MGPCAKGLSNVPCGDATIDGKCGNDLELVCVGERIYEAAAAEYKKLHPNVTVTVLTAALRDFEQKMAATIPADSAGDILEANPFAIQKFIVADMLPPVPDDLVQWMTAQGRFNEALVKNNLYNGKYYGVPYLVGRHGIYYNTDMFAAAGLPADGPKTMDDLRNFAKKLAKYDAAGNLTVSGISLRLSGAGSGIAEKFWMYLYPMGGSLVEQTKSGKWHNNYNNDAGLATLQWYLDIVYKDKTNNPQVPADTAGFSDGKVAMYARESSPIGAIAKNAPNLKYATVPMPKGVRWGDLANGENLYVTRNSKYPEVAWDFVKFMLSKPDEWLAKAGFVQPVKGVAETEVAKKFPFFDVHMKDVQTASWYLRSEHVNEIAQAVGRAVEAVVYDGADPKAQLDAAQAAVEKVIKK